MCILLSKASIQEHPYENLVILEIALTSHNPAIWFLLYYRKNFVNIPTWVCVSFSRNDAGKNPTILQLVTLKPTHPQGKKTASLSTWTILFFVDFGNTVEPR